MNDVRERSFMKALFHGVISEELILPYPSLPAEDRDRVGTLIEEVRALGRAHVDSAAIDREARIPDELMAEMRGLGLFGMIVPKEYGGLGLSNTGYARVVQELATIDPTLAVTVGSHQTLGLRGILLFGTDAQKRKYLPRLASGERLAAFALTEPGAGSDAAGITTRADLAIDGEGYTLSGSKVLITNGSTADVFTVFARTRPAEPGSKPKITALLVERGYGVVSGANDSKMGTRGLSTSPLYFEDVKVPAANVLGEVGRGFKVAMEVLNSGRLGLAACSLGASKHLVQLAVERARERKAFGRSIGHFEMIQEKIARMVAETYALESMIYLTTGLVDSGLPDYSLESAICKVYGSETYWRIADETARIAGGIGYMSDHPYERMLRDARLHLVYEGTNEILRAFIALAGMQSPGKQMADVVRAIREPIKGFGVLSEFAIRRARSALGRERLSLIHPVLKREAVHFEEWVTTLAREVDRVIRKYGEEITERQLIQKRIAEAAIDLYALAAVLARTTRAIEARGEEGARRYIELAIGFSALAHERLKERLTDVEREDDEILKHVALRSYDEGGYAFDVTA